MGEEAKIVIIKRLGADGPHFPLRRQEYLFGRLAQRFSVFLIDYLLCNSTLGNIRC